MVELVTPISHLFADPQQADAIIAASDCLEGRDHTRESRLPGQKLFHCDKEIIHPWTDDDRAYIEKVVRTKSELRLVSFHMASCCSRPALVDGIFQREGTTFLRGELIAFALENTRWLKTILNKRGIEIAVENNNYYPTAAYEHITDGDFITEVIERCGLWFLFDIAHAKVTAHNRGLDYEQYLSALPTDRMVQVHLSQHAVNEKGMAFDAHILPQESLYRDMSAVFESWKPQYLTVEFYKNTEELIGILKRCREVLDHVCPKSRN